MKKSTILAAAVFTLIAFFSFASELHAQEEYRIRQTLPANIDSIYVTAGWKVHIQQAAEASITIVTPCSSFFDNDSEPEVCKIEGNALILLGNNTMPKSTVVEITLANPLFLLEIGEDATVTTGTLEFAPSKECAKTEVNIMERATVEGSSWHSNRSLFININPDASLKMDSLVAKRTLDIDQFEGASFECPNMISSDTELSRSKKAKGPVYESDSTKNLKVNTLWYLSREKHGLFVNGGIDAPIPLYMNNKQGSPYSRGENYRIRLQMNFIDVNLGKKMSFVPYFIYEWDWRRLLNTVKKEGDALVLDNSYGALNPQQHLLAQNIGIDYTFRYSFGKVNQKTGMKPYSLNFGLAATYNISGRLATRTMGDDNRWHRTNEKVDVFNPWQLRAHIGIGGGPLTRATLSLTYDLLPTFRSSIGADKVHTFGVSINF